MDINPNAVGHTLCVPKQEVDKLFDLDQEIYMHLMQFSKRIAAALEQAVPCKRVGMAVVGLEVPHAHVHLIPIHQMTDMSFQTKVKMQEEDFISLAKKQVRCIRRTHHQFGVALPSFAADLGGNHSIYFTQHQTPFSQRHLMQV